MDATRHPLTVLAVTDVAGMTTFYEAAFGWTRKQDFPIYVEVATPDDQRIAFYERGAFGQNTGITPAPVEEGQLTGAELYLRCEDLDAVTARLASLDARCLRERTLKDWGEEVAYYADPEGNTIAVAQAR